MAKLDGPPIGKRVALTKDCTYVRVTMETMIPTSSALLKEVTLSLCLSICLSVCVLFLNIRMVHIILCRYVVREMSGGFGFWVHFPWFCAYYYAFFGFYNRNSFILGREFEPGTPYIRPWLLALSKQSMGAKDQQNFIAHILFVNVY